MTDYDLYYWPVPFRGQFVRAILAHAGKSWTEFDGADIEKLMSGRIENQPVPFMGPPVLVDRRTGVALAQMPAIVLYLGETLELLPADSGARALAMKIVLDANDIIDEITIDGGKQMWTTERWDEFVPRLQKWMRIFEDTARRHGVTGDAGHLLGGDAPSVADIVTAVLWSTLGARFEQIDAMLKETAPLTAALTKRTAALPPMAALSARAFEDYGDAYCGGEIERSLRRVLR